MSLTSQLGIYALFDAQAAAHQNRDFQLHFLLQLAVGFGKDNHFHRACHIFQRALGVKIALLRLEHAQVGDDAGGADVLIFPSGGLDGGDFRRAQRAQVFQLVACIFPGDGR